MGATAMMTSTNEQLLNEIRETNLSYLMLAQRMIREDRAQALFRLGLTEETADLIAGLSTAQLLKIAATNLLMCRFRFSEDMVWNLLTGVTKDASIAKVHAAILMAGAPAEAIPA